MKISKINISPEVYENIDVQERILLITVGHISNELNLLRKLIVVSWSGKAVSEIEKEGQATLSLMLIKLFALKSFEGHKTISKRSKLLNNILKDTPAPHNESFRNLNKYFGKSNILTKLRNEMAGHYDEELIGRTVEAKSNIGGHIYLSEHQGLSLYSISESVLINALEYFEFGELSTPEKLSKIIEDVDEVANWLTQSAQAVTRYIGQKYLADFSEQFKNYKSMPSIKSKKFEIPFLIDFSDNVT